VVSSLFFQRPVFKKITEFDFRLMIAGNMPSSLIGYLLLIIVLTRRKMWLMLVRVSRVILKMAISDIVRISLVQ